MSQAYTDLVNDCADDVLEVMKKHLERHEHEIVAGATVLQLTMLKFAVFLAVRNGLPSDEVITGFKELNKRGTQEVDNNVLQTGQLNQWYAEEMQQQGAI